MALDPELKRSRFYVMYVGTKAGQALILQVDNHALNISSDDVEKNYCVSSDDGAIRRDFDSKTSSSQVKCRILQEMNIVDETLGKHVPVHLTLYCFSLPDVMGKLTRTFIADQRSSCSCCERKFCHIVEHLQHLSFSCKLPFPSSSRSIHPHQKYWADEPTGLRRRRRRRDMTVRARPGGAGKGTNRGEGEKNLELGEMFGIIHLGDGRTEGKTSDAVAEPEGRGGDVRVDEDEDEGGEAGKRGGRR
eukprot:768743-Hanusia_phi.AAC.5